MKITILYKCSCSSKEQSFDVRARGEHEDIDDWMNALREKFGKVHARRSPLCRATKCEYIKILTQERTPIGGVPELDS